MKKRITSLVLVLIMLLTAIPFSAFTVSAATEYTEPTLVVQSVYTAVGSTVDVKVDVKNNPGIAGATLNIDYDSNLTLIGATNGNAFSDLTLTLPGSFTNPSKFLWDSLSGEVKADDTILILKFRVSEDTLENSNLNVNVSYQQGDIYNEDMEEVSFQTVNGCVTVINYIPGDVNDDGIINGKDVTFVRRHIVGGYEQTMIEEAADVNADGRINGMDVTLIRRHIVEGTELKPAPVKCNHNMTLTEYKAATCEADGNIAYWHCSACDKYFSDKDGETEVTLENTVIPTTGHTIVIDPAVEPTDNSVGYTEGAHCSVCNYVKVEQIEIPKLETEEFAIVYHITDGDTYLASQAIDNTNPLAYTSTQNTITLANLKAPDGYTFLGWYDAPKENKDAVRIKSIEKGSTGSMELYAHWEKQIFNIQFDVGLTNIDPSLVSVPSDTYTVDQGKVLPNPKLDGYIFAGWSDDDGKVFKRIPVGTIGHKTYTGNWVSERNLAYTKHALDEPIVYEDSEFILFTYEIGEIRNVPLYTLCDFGKINTTGIEVTKEFEHSTTTSKTMMEGLTDVISTATTESFGWTLSNEWSHATDINEEWAESNGLTVAEAEEICTNETNNWYISNGYSHTDTTVTLDTTDTYNLKTTTKNTKKYNTKDKERRQDFSAGLNVDGKLSKTINASIGLNESSSIGVGGTSEIGLGVDLKYSQGKTTSSKTGTEKDTGSENQNGTITHTGEETTNSTTWNTESGKSGSYGVSQTESISSEISKQINEKYGYGESYIDTENKTQDQNFASTNTNSKECSSSVTFGTTKTTTVKETYSTTNTISGYHRIIMAGTAHVFAIVGYDIKNQSYFVSTHTVMDDEQHQYQDYSYDYATYDDNQSSIIEFEAPDDITLYVAERVNASDGLEVNKSGMITAYKGTDEFVIIPEYKVIRNSDGTNTVVKVTSISPDAFAGNTNLQLIEMSDYVTEIPEGAFRGCSSLLSFEADGVTTIGKHAFEGCTSLKACSLGENIKTLGENAFEGMEYFSINAANKNIVEAAAKSGAKNITVGISNKCTDLKDSTITIPNGTETFVFNGYLNEFNNVSIISDATKTIITRATFNSTGKAPLQISSKDIQLQEVVVNSRGIGLITSADDVTISLYGESYINSESKKAILCKTVDLEKLGTDYYSQLNVDGNVLVYGGNVDKSYLTFVSGKIVPIDEDTFKKYLKGVSNVTFKPNGGKVDTLSVEVYYGETISQLPVSTRDNYDFVGWFTDNTGGTEFTKDTVIETVEDFTLYARWSPKEFTVTYDVNGDDATVSTPTEILSFGDSYSLPDPMRDYYTFDGWYTEISGGERVTSNTVITEAKDVTLYAHWIHNPVSDWVLASDVPVDAQIIDSKWSYTLREYTSSSSPSLSGYTKYDTQRTSWGATQGPVYSDPSNGVRYVTSENYVSSTTTHYKYYHRYGWYNGGYAFGTDATASSWARHGIDLTYSLSPSWYSSDYGIQFYGNYACPNCGNGIHWVQDGTYTTNNYSTRWYYQEPVYTYYYYRDVVKESTSDPTGQSNVSNVVKYVQYRAK